MPNPPPLRLSVASPCKAAWSDMQGDDRVRFCAACKKDVFNLSALSREEAAALLHREGGPPCVTYFQRADGTVMTQDCPVGRMARLRRRTATALAAAASLVVSACRGEVPAPPAPPPAPPAVHDATAAALPQDAVRVTGEPMPPGRSTEAAPTPDAGTARDAGT